MITDNFYIEKVLSEYFNDLGNKYNNFRVKSYTIYNYCINSDPNLNNKIKYAIAASFYALDQTMRLEKLIQTTTDFMEKEQLFEHIEETTQLLNCPIEPFKSALLKKSEVMELSKKLNKELALH